VSEQPHKQRRPLILAAVWLGYIALTGAVLSQARVEANAGPAPLEAIKINLTHARALANASSNRAGDQTPLGQTAAKQYALRALARDPLNSDALRVLASLSDVSSDLVLTQKYLDASNRRSRRSLKTNAAVMVNATLRGDVKTLMVALDSVMRVAPGNVVGPTAKIIGQAIPILPEIEERLIESLKAKPSWSSSFLANLSGEISDGDVSLRILKRLKAEGVLDEEAVVRSWIGNLVARQHYPQSRVAMALLDNDPAGFGSIMTSLSFKVSQTVFDWSFANNDGGISAGYEAGEAARTGKIWAMNSGSSGGNIVASKLLMLDAGSYRFRTTAQSDQALGLDDFKWVIGCHNNGALLGTTAAAPQKQAIVLNFDVPAAQCDAVFVRVMTNARDRLDRTQVSYRDLAIEKIATSRVSQP